MPDMDNETRYSLADLARVAGVTPRTVRYYIAQGLLPGANDPGSAAWYDDGHLARLRLVRDLQRRHLPLAEIRANLEGMTDEAVSDLLVTRSEQPAVRESALDYVRSVLGETVAPRPVSPSRPAPMAPDAASLAMPAMRRVLRSPSPAFLESSDPFEPPALPTPSDPAPTRSQWDRIPITADIELHVRRPLSPLHNKRVERLITIARQVLKEEAP